MQISKKYIKFLTDYNNLLLEILNKINKDEYKSLSLEELKKYNKKLFAPIKNNNSFLLDNSDELHQYLSFFAWELVTTFRIEIFKYGSESFKIHQCYFEQIVQIFKDFNNGYKNLEDIKNCILNFNKDNLEWKTTRNIINMVVNPYLDNIINNSDLNNPNYLYYYGTYISENEINIFNYLNSIDENKIKEIAKTIINGFKRGYKNQNLDLTKKGFITLYYPIGFEKIAKEISLLLKDEISVIFAISNKTICNRQMNYFHKNDNYLYLDEDYMRNLLSIYKNNLKSLSFALSQYGGPLYIETFGEKKFNPKNEFLFENNNEKQKLEKEFKNKYALMYNKYTNKEERSFTIISYPCPDIGENFEEIFNEMMIINNLDNEKYQKIQQTIIDVLDQGEYVQLIGKNKNKTNLIIKLNSLKNKNKETLFENCTADVNIPVGEVFTTPVLNGTNGILNVSKVYLNGLQYKDLTFEFENGKVKSYSCDNFDNEEENLNFIKENILHNYETLPIGEFAIGTNTMAYTFARKFKIEDKLDILVAEKTGPHIALGDTCFSYQEDLKTFNPNGKEIIAKDNEISKNRKNNIDKAYFGCHTDITIPFDEIEIIKIITKDKFEIPIIKNGYFVLEGTEELNKPFTNKKDI